MFDLVIIGAFFATMIIFAILDQRSLMKGEHKDYKSLIVSAGVLGTFLGIFKGLWNFDTSNIEASVPQLLDGLKLAFVTSIFGMFTSISLGAVQKRSKSAAEDEMSALTSIDSKLTPIAKIESTGKETVEQLKHLRMELRDEQMKLRVFVEEQFTKTNEVLNQAIETLSRGATEEIIKALKDVIADFNQNLTEQFGDNFKQLNQAVDRLVKWQEQYKEHLEFTENVLTETRTSLSNSAEMISAIASRNNETKEFYEQLSKVILTFDTQVKTINEQLSSYAKLGEDAKKSFGILEESHRDINSQISELTKNIQSSLSAQSESLSKLTQEILNKLPESLGELERTLTGLTNKFAEDYRAFLDKYNELVTR